MCALESFITTLLIDAYEDRDVAIYNVPGAYLHADIPKDKLLLMIFREQFVDIICGVNPDFKQHVRTIKGKKVFYVTVQQAIYGCIESALLWYKCYTEKFEKEGFKINPYDKCVANKMIDGYQCTLVWYVNDTKVSHKSAKVVDEILEIMKGYFGKLTITRGKEQQFLG
eukprot:7530993-Ditylum_brightwellii.AAC.1